MRIKKKNVLKESLILEGLLIDDLNFDPFIKKALKSLHRQYKNVSTWDINTNNLIDELHVKFNIPLEKAFKIVTTYIYKRDYLFKEHDFIKDVDVKDIFSRYGKNFFKKFKETLDNELLTATGEFWELKIGDIHLPYEVHFWDSYNGYSLYLPVDLNYRWANGSGFASAYDKYTILLHIDFNWESSTFDIKYRIGDDSSNQKSFISNNLSFEYPEGEITMEKGLQWVKNNVNNVVKPIILNFNFPSV